jgi:hypothetical protein
MTYHLKPIGLQMMWLYVLSSFLKTSLDVKATEHAMKKKVERVGFEPFSLDGCHLIELLIVDRKSNLRKQAKVVGSIPSVDPSFRKQHKDIIPCEPTTLHS